MAPALLLLLVVLVLGTAGCGADDEERPGGGPLATLRIAGGLRPEADELRIARSGAATIRTRDHPARSFRVARSEADRIAKAFAAADWSEAKRSYLPPRPIPDGMVWSVTYAGREVRFDRSRLPARFEKPVDLLEDVLERRRPR